MRFNEDTRVKIPAILALTRLGYDYLSLKNQTDIDPKTNIFKDIFFDALKKINPTVESEEIYKYFIKIQTCLDNDDLGKEFYKLLSSQSGIKLIDFQNIKNNIFNVVTELTCGSVDDDNFRPDITLLINGVPLAFIEVKKPNNREGVIAERNRINIRFKNPKFRRFINISQILFFSNNMEYVENDPNPIQGAFYATASKDKAFFNQFKEESLSRQQLFAVLKPESEEAENALLHDINYTSIKFTQEFVASKDLNTPTNRAIISLFSKQRLFELLQYGLTYVEYDDEDGIHHLEKHIMRYQQFFASKAIQNSLEKGIRKGIIWHTQGSGKTALAYFNVRWLTDYYQSKNIVPKFYFIVDRLDLKEQADREMTIRGLRVNPIDSREGFIKDLKRVSALSGNSGEQEITILNIQKFSDAARATDKSDYDINTQRIYFIDEAHRSYNPKGSFLVNLIQSDPNAIIISLTGTPLLDKGGTRIPTKSIFGDYIHKYYYDQSICDGYTLRLIREEIESSYKLKLKDIFEKIKVPEGDTRIKQIYAHKNFCMPLLDYIAEDLRKSRIWHNDNTIGAMVVCHSSEQARMLFDLFKEQYESKSTDSNTAKVAALILHDENTKDDRKNSVKSFKHSKIDLLFVYNMLLTGFDSPRLKKLYVGRVIKEHNLLQTLTRVNRPYKNFNYGYVVDFADIQEAFNKANRDYWQELQQDWGDDMKAYTNLFKSAEEIENDIKEITDKLWNYNTLNAEIFQQQISQIHEKKELLVIRKALQIAAELYNAIRLAGHTELLGKLDFKKFKSLLSEVENRIALLAQRETLKNQTDISGLLNTALEESIFIFRKTGENALDLTADEFKDILRKTREKMQANIDKKDPLWVSLKDEIERLLKSRNWEDASEDDLNEGVKYFSDIYSKILELNRKNDLLLDKYHGDEKYVRVHKELARSAIGNQAQDVLLTLLGIKQDIDLQLLKANILHNRPYFEGYIQPKIISGFGNSNIKLDVETAKAIKTLLANEYLNERNNFGRIQL